MPSPLGHALAGMAAGWAVSHPARTRGAALRRGALFAGVALLPDLDLLVPTHRGASHSLAAAVLAGAAAWVWMRVTAREAMRGAPARRSLRTAAAVAAAYSTHTLLDWLGSDSSAPFGIMALWPVSQEYYIAPRDLFLAISRRYWLPDFWHLNLRAIVRELLILGPVAAVAWKVGRRRAAGEEGRGG